ncbi:hypothetical protein [Haloarcula sp. Atlit-7R]|uniref:hypothetical protein n=1 Tax=Haloarcula sp. Atlit-7R TaxID=2282125 RepID=UPI0011C49236|nr:hypothetical protein [Haloarcula sp. Atlit-7R]
MYDPEKPGGVSAGVYDGEGVWLGAIKTLEVDDTDPDEEQTIDLAVKLMRAINQGVYDDTITNLSP